MSLAVALARSDRMHDAAVVMHSLDHLRIVVFVEIHTLLVETLSETQAAALVVRDI